MERGRGPAARRAPILKECTTGAPILLVVAAAVGIITFSMDPGGESILDDYFSGKNLGSSGLLGQKEGAAVKVPPLASSRQRSSDPFAKLVRQLDDELVPKSELQKKHNHPIFNMVRNKENFLKVYDAVSRRYNPYFAKILQVKGHSMYCELEGNFTETYYKYQWLLKMKSKHMTEYKYGYDGKLRMFETDTLGHVETLDVEDREYGLLRRWIQSGMWTTLNVLKRLEVDLSHDLDTVDWRDDPHTHPELVHVEDNEDVNPKETVRLSFKLRGGTGLKAIATYNMNNWDLMSIDIPYGGRVQRISYCQYKDFCNGEVRLPSLVHLIWDQAPIANTLKVTDVQYLNISLHPDYFNRKSPICPADVVWHHGVSSAVPIWKHVAGHLTIRATINGFDAPGYFILDTCSSACCITKAFADKLKLPEFGSTLAMEPNGMMKTQFRKLRSLKVGPLEIRDLVALQIQTLDHFGQEPGHLLGILGYDFWRRAVVEVPARLPGKLFYSLEQPSGYIQVHHPHNCPVFPDMPPSSALTTKEKKKKSSIRRNATDHNDDHNDDADNDNDAAAAVSGIRPQDNLVKMEGSLRHPRYENGSVLKVDMLIDKHRVSRERGAGKLLASPDKENLLSHSMDTEEEIERFRVALKLKEEKEKNNCTEDPTKEAERADAISRLDAKFEQVMGRKKRFLLSEIDSWKNRDESGLEEVNNQYVGLISSSDENIPVLESEDLEIDGVGGEDEGRLSRMRLDVNQTTNTARLGFADFYGEGAVYSMGKIFGNLSYKGEWGGIFALEPKALAQWTRIRFFSRVPSISCIIKSQERRATSRCRLLIDTGAAGTPLIFHGRGGKTLQLGRSEIGGTSSVHGMTSVSGRLEDYNQRVLMDRLQVPMLIVGGRIVNNVTAIKISSLSFDIAPGLMGFISHRLFCNFHMIYDYPRRRLCMRSDGDQTATVAAMDFEGIRQEHYLYEDDMLKLASQ